MKAARAMVCRVFAGACLAASLGGVGGCAAGLNERVAIGTRPTASFGGGTGPGGGAAGPGTLDRTRWRTMVVVAPIDGVVHSEPFRMIRPVSRRAPADRAGAFPFSAPPGGAGDSQAWEALREVGRSAADVVWGPARGWRAVRGGRAGWWTWSPAEIWKRTRGDRTAWSGVGAIRARTTNEEGTDGSE
jgi:hypothetical protein